MKLNEIIDQIKTLEGYVYHRLRATDHLEMVQCYTFWFKKNGEMRDHEVRFLVVDKDTPEEEAWVYSTKHLHPGESPFKDEIALKIPLFQAANPDYEKILIASVKEADEVAELRAYKYDSETDTSERLELVAFRKDGTLTVRKLG